ncbi:unnamed protein product [Linum trigynum]|uniref:F-box domain-containing protein n=1 Tax=Linum trigynum TaxID=586398 RepID=A0AAV2EJ71_9ROSI
MATEENSSKIARRTEPGIGDDEDRLSSLPDQVLSHILSFMETKYAVGTAVLSRRWEDLWTRVSILDLDSRLIYESLNKEEEELEPASEAVLERRESEFCRFVDKVLGQHKNLNSLTRFRFHFSNGHRKVLSETRFKREFVFGPPMEEIDVMIRGKSKFGIPLCMRCIPESFYTLRNLKVAKLSGVMLGAINQSALLPSVKILRLYRVEMKDGESLDRLLCGCHVLETLHLKNCRLSDKNEGDRIEVSLPLLKNLKISHYAIWDGPMCPIVIEAPNLEDLYVEDFAELQLNGTNPLPCLHSAHVDVQVESYSAVIRLLSQISNAKKLNLSGVTLSLLSAVDYVQLPVFPNLTHLTIEIGEFQGSIWHSLLKSASKLQSLVFDKEKTSGVERMRWEDFETASTPECLLSSLEEIKIKDLAIYPGVKKIIAYLLGAGAVLKKVNMHPNGTYLKLKGHKDFVPLLELPKRSSACEVELIFFDDEDFSRDSDAESNTSDDNDGEDVFL